MSLLKIPKLTSKSVCMPFFIAGGFGNRLRAWKSLKEFEKDGCPREVMIRYTSGRGGQGPCEYPVAGNKVAERIHAWIAAGKDPKRIWINEMAPDHRLLINGELADDWHFFYSRLHLPMRKALREGGKRMNGLQTRLTLKGLMTPSSWEDLLVIMDLFPDHVIELSVYECLLGNLPMRNTIVWEVRDY